MTWQKSIPSRPVVAVAGATGAVGREFLKVLHELDFPASEVRALASVRSAGKKLPFDGCGDVPAGELVVQRVEAFEVRVHRGQQRFGRLLFFKNYLLHCGQHIDRRGKARAVQAPVVILAAERNVPLALEAALEEERKERRGDHIQPAPLVERFAHGRENPLPYGGEERVHIRALRELFPHNRIDDVCKRQRADIRNFHAFAGDDELPAGGHGVIARVLFVVAQRRQRGNRHVVVFILRKAQPQFG